MKTLGLKGLMTSENCRIRIVFMTKLSMGFHLKRQFYPIINLPDLIFVKIL